MTAVSHARAEAGLIERCLPAHLMALLAEQLRLQGWELRADINRYLNSVAVAPLARLDPIRQRRVATAVDKVARSLLHDLAPDEPRQGLLACAFFTLALVDEGLLPDPRNQAVLVALLLVTEARDIDEWRLHEASAQSAAKSLLRRARLQGFYLPVRSVSV